MKFLLTVKQINLCESTLNKKFIIHFYCYHKFSLSALYRTANFYYPLLPHTKFSLSAIYRLTKFNYPQHTVVVKSIIPHVTDEHKFYWKYTVDLNVVIHQTPLLYRGQKFIIRKNRHVKSHYPL